MTTRATQRAAATSAVAPLFGTAAALDHRTLLAAVATSTPAIRQPRRGAPITPDAQLQLAYEAQPRFFALAALSPSATDSQRAQILLALLASSRQTLDPAARSTCERVADLLVEALDASTVVDVLLALRRARTNHRHATRLAVRFTLAGDRAEDLVVLRPRAVRDIVEHALGARVARAAGA
ncbi:MAG: hypothetical protein KC503_46050, partial [Myxococcales bacterium]|nr:hypothetical protein [Myxococcales bacterium]